MNFARDSRPRPAVTRPVEEPVAALSRRSVNNLFIQNVHLTFPFNPYSVQVAFMEKLITALQQGDNALLESPTGTGKTMCLLCGCLAWQQTFTAAVQQAKLLSSNPTTSSRFVGEDGVINPSVITDPEIRALFAAAGRIQLPSSPEPQAADVGTTLLHQKLRAAGFGASAAPTLGTAAGPGFAIPERARGEYRPKIIYASRTHTQLSQVVREIKNSGYNPKMSILGSREQLCVHPTVSKLSGNPQSYACRSLVRGRKCGYKLELDNQLLGTGTVAHLLDTSSAAAGSSATLLDIEELAAAGKKNRFCPYFYSRERQIQQDADIILIPYNYLLDPNARKQALEHVDLRNSVLIFDEAHNVEQVCAEAASFDLSAADLARCMEELRLAVEPFHKHAVAASAGSRAGTGLTDSDEIGSMGPTSANFDPRDALQLRLLLLQLEKWIDTVDLVTGLPAAGASGPVVGPRPKPGTVSTMKVDNQPALVADGSFMYDIFQSQSINQETVGILLDLIDNIILFLNSRDTIVGGLAGGRGGYALEALKSILQRVFKDAATIERMKVGYRVVIHTPPGDTKTADGRPLIRGRTLSYWSFSPGAAMAELKALGVRSIILASGTLSPMDSYACELELPFPVRLENEHIIADDQVFMAVARAGPNGITLNSSFENRSRDDYKRELGAAIAGIVRVVPGGVLVFFPSYGLLHDCVTFWREDRGGEIWKRMSASKTALIVEARRQEEFLRQIKEFNEAVDGSGGAVLFGVCRGKVSEGIDFADARGRAVIVTGIPFPPHMDPKVVLKRRYLEDLRKSDASRLSGGAWYNLQAFRSINQAIGRVIRHEKDYGAIILLDERFDRDRAGISAWLRPKLIVYRQTNEMTDKLSVFFRNAATKTTLSDFSEFRQQSSAAITSSSASTALTTRSPGMPRQPVPDEHIDPTVKMLRELRAKRGDVPQPTSDAIPSLAAPRLLQPTSLFRGSDQGPSIRPLRFGATKLEAALHKIESNEPITSGHTPAPDADVSRRSMTDDARKLRAQAFMENLKATVSADLYTDFRGVLKTFKSADTPVDEHKVRSLVHAVAGVLAKEIAPEQITGFLNELLAFIPSKFVPFAKETISAWSAAQAQPTAPPRLPPSTVGKHANIDLVLGSAAPVRLLPSKSLDVVRRAPFAAATDTARIAQKEVFIEAPSVSGLKRPRQEGPPVGPPSDGGDRPSSPTSASAPKMKCAVCLELQDVMLAAHCGHILCEPCWQRSLATKLECPLCRRFVREKQLVRLRPNE